MKKYSVIGNKKKVTIEVNNGRLKVVGNNCIVLVATNMGDIEVIGNECRIDVSDNHGVVNLVGGNGRVNIKKRWDGDKVQVVGPYCHLKINGKMQAQEAELSPFSRDLDDVIESVFTFVMR